MQTIPNTSTVYTPWNKGKLIGQKAPLKLKDIWAIRIRLQLSHKVRDLALLHKAVVFYLEQLFFKTKPKGLYSSKLQNKHEAPLQTGSHWRN